MPFFVAVLGFKEVDVCGCIRGRERYFVGTKSSLLRGLRSHVLCCLVVWFGFGWVGLLVVWLYR